jgi:hypothetical protein
MGAFRLRVPAAAEVRSGRGRSRNDLAVAKAGFGVYQDNASEWRWRLRAKNGQLLTNGGEGFASKGNVL